MKGFGKITYEEFIEMVKLMNNFSKLDEANKELILIMIDGLIYRGTK